MYHSCLLLKLTCIVLVFFISYLLSTRPYAFLFIIQVKSHHVKERDSSPVTAILWNDNGDKLFVGYASGKLLSFAFNKDKVY